MKVLLPIPAGRRKPGLAAKFALAAGSVLLVALAFEAAGRVYLRFAAAPGDLRIRRTEPQIEASWTDFDPDLGWRNRPGAQVLDAATGASIRINPQGFRTNSPTPPIPAGGRRRILALGDSFTFGYGVEADQTWPAQLEARLSGVEVVNLGVCAYGLDQILLAYEKVSDAYAHEGVILGFFAWDVHRATHDVTVNGYSHPMFAERGGELILTNHPAPPPKPYGSPVFGGSVWEGILRQAWINRETNRFLYNPPQSAGWRLALPLVRRLKREAERRGAWFAAVEIPWSKTLAAPEAHPFLQASRGLFAAAGVPFALAHAEFQRLSAEGTILYTEASGGHCSAAGNRAIAAAAAKLVPGGG